MNPQQALQFLSGYLGQNLVRLDLKEVETAMSFALVPLRCMTLKGHSEVVLSIKNLCPVISCHYQIVKLLNKEKLRRLSLTSATYGTPAVFMDSISSEAFFKNENYQISKPSSFQTTEEEIKNARDILSEEHELFLNFTDELRQFTNLEYLHFEMTTGSRLTLPTLSDLIFEKQHLEYLQVDFLRETEELP